jgi:hypothetical protein
LGGGLLISSLNYGDSGVCRLQVANVPIKPTPDT